MRWLPIGLLACLLSACTAMPERVDTIFHNGRIYTVDSAFSVVEALAVQGDTIAAVGSSQKLLNAYSADTTIDLEGRPVYPGFIDAHCHFYWHGQQLKQVDLSGADSFEAILQRLQNADTNAAAEEWLRGQGWDQHKWANPTMPDRQKLDSLFPKRPVGCQRPADRFAAGRGGGIGSAATTGTGFSRPAPSADGCPAGLFGERVDHRQ